MRAFAAASPSTRARTWARTPAPPVNLSYDVPLGFTGKIRQVTIGLKCWPRS
jgi:hypothetical protein